MTDEIPQPTAYTRVAIEFLTLWMEPGDQARLEAARHIEGIVEAPDANIPGIIAGLLNLNTVTLFELAKARGAMTEEMYYRVAGDFLRELSSGLPE
jgi:hypothetical protein